MSSDHPGQPADLRPAVAAALEVGANARTQRLRLADVEDAAVGLTEQVDTGRRRKPFQLLFDVVVHPRSGYRHGDEGPARRGRNSGLVIVAPAAQSGGPGLIVGAAEDDVKANTLVQAQAKLDLLRARRPRRRPRDLDLGSRRSRLADRRADEAENLASAAKVDGIDVYVPSTTREQDDTAERRRPGELRRARRRPWPAQRPDSRTSCRQRAEPEPVLAAAVRPGRL